MITFEKWMIVAVVDVCVCVFTCVIAADVLLVGICMDCHVMYKEMASSKLLQWEGIRYVHFVDH